VRNRAPAARFGALVALVVLPIAAAACGDGSGSKGAGSKASTSRACTYIAKLDTIAQTVAQADVSDPDGFKKTLDTAVRDYVANLVELRAAAPADLHASIDRAQADVQQYRFEAAVGDRAPLDVYAQRECGRVPSASTSAPTTAPTEPTSSTVPAPGG